MKSWTIFGFIRYFFLVFLAGLLGLQCAFLLQVWWLKEHNPSTTSFMFQEEVRLCGARRAFLNQCPLQYSWVDYDRVSNHLKQAIISSEDAKFNDHYGVEIESITKAWQKNQRKGAFYMGGSTITQQLAKNMFLSGERSYIRKAQELVIAFFMETILEKKRIFELYINVVEWGDGIFGIDAASRYYYRMHPAYLSASQSAELASALPSPKCFDKSQYCSSDGMHYYFAKKKQVILQRMRGAALPNDTLDVLIKKHSK